MHAILSQYTYQSTSKSTWHMAIFTQGEHPWNLKYFSIQKGTKQNQRTITILWQKYFRGNLSPSPKTGLKALLTQSAKTITVQPGPSRSILPGRHIKAAILNHVSRRTSNDYWAPAYFNINSLEAGIGGREEEEGEWNQRQQGESSAHSD